MGIYTATKNIMDSVTLELHKVSFIHHKWSASIW